MAQRLLESLIISIVTLFLFIIIVKLSQSIVLSIIMGVLSSYHITLCCRYIVTGKKWDDWNT